MRTCSRPLGTDAPLKATVLDPAKADGFPKGWVVSDRAAVSWSDDNKRVYFGTKPQVPVADARRRSTDEVADVDIWNTADERIQSQQMIRAEADRNFTFRQGFDVTSGRFIKLADETMREIDFALTGKWAVGRDTRGYIHDYKRPAADIYRVNTATGERTLIYKNFATGQGLLGLSPNGKQFLFWKDNRLNVHDLDAGSARILGGPTPPSFIDTEFDRPGPAAVVRHRRVHARRQRGHRAAALRPVAAAARWISGEEPDERLRHEERDPAAPGAVGAARSDG